MGGNKKFEKTIKVSGVFDQRRKDQSIEWVFRMVEDTLKDEFYNNEKIQKAIISVKEEITKDKITPTLAAEKLLNIFKTK